MRGFIRGRCSLMTSFRHPFTTSPDWPNPCWQVTQRRRRVLQNYNDKQIRLHPRISSSEITGRPVPLSGLSRPKFCETLSTIRCRRSLPNPLWRLSYIDVMQAFETGRLHSHYTLDAPLCARRNLSGFFSIFDRPIQLHVVESN
jgi:hypothetical protein